jgi:DNA polymerase-3 subunit gamma/tau
MGARYWSSSPVVRVVPLTGEAHDLPSTVREKKNRDTAGRQRELEESARKNTVVSAALEIFGGEIGEVVEIQQHTDTKEDSD